LAGAHLFDEKSAKMLHYSGLDCGMLEFFTHKPAIQRPIVDFPAFLETDLAEKMAVCDHTTRDPNR
jgi:hypothetical protein